MERDIIATLRTIIANINVFIIINVIVYITTLCYFEIPHLLGKEFIKKGAYRDETKYR